MCIKLHSLNTTSHVYYFGDFQLCCLMDLGSSGELLFDTRVQHLLLGFDNNQEWQV